MKTLHEIMPDSAVPKFFREATGRRYSGKESAINDIRRMLRLYESKIASQPVDASDPKTKRSFLTWLKSLWNGFTSLPGW